MIPVEVKVWGDLACFTSHETPVERVSYPVPTPSAARGVLEAILMKVINRRAAMHWQIEEIWVLNPIRTIRITRNEVKLGMRDNAGIDITTARTPRQTIALRDVAYLIRAQIEVANGVAADVAKYRDQFRRRVRDGRCFSRPYLGMREFVAFFSAPDGTEQPIDETWDLGRMLYDMEYAADEAGQPSDRGTPLWYQPRLERGIIRVPPLSTVRARMAGGAGSSVRSAQPQSATRAASPPQTPAWSVC
jgi:CRISPR-associated protein Cas5d